MYYMMRGCKFHSLNSFTEFIHDFITEPDIVRFLNSEWRNILLFKSSVDIRKNQLWHPEIKCKHISLYWPSTHQLLIFSHPLHHFYLVLYYLMHLSFLLNFEILSAIIKVILLTEKYVKDSFLKNYAFCLWYVKSKQ